MLALHRHQLVRLTEAGWKAVVAGEWDAQARGCLQHWSTHGLPLVVTRQDAGAVGADTIAVGLPAPACWGRRRLALRVPRDAVLAQHEFPGIDQLPAMFRGAPRAALRALDDALRASHATAHVFGSYGWQLLTGLDHVRAGSDVDLWVAVDDAAQADVVAALFGSFMADQARATSRLRLDGELVFRDGSAVAWREWAAWRAGTSRAAVVKRLEGVSLHREADWCAVSQGMVA